MNLIIYLRNRRHNVDNILSGFSKALKRLEAAVAAHEANAAYAEELALKVKAKAKTHKQEAERALKSAAKLRDLVG